jgi:hypothetical protein
VSERVLTIRELNRATLARQLLLERHALTVPRAIERVCALQAQWPTSPYVALWSRVRDFRRDALTRALERRAVIRSTLMRTTIHMLSRADYLALATLWQTRRRGQHARDGGDVDADETAARLALAGADRAFADLNRELGEAFSRRFGPLVPLAHVPPAGTWRHHGSTRLAEAERWLDGTFGDARVAAALLVERYLRGYGPASLGDLRRFSGLPTQDLASGLESLEPRLRRCRDEEGRLLLDLVRLPLPAADASAPPRFLGRWDNALIGYDRRTRILPDEFSGRSIGHAGDQVVLVDGFVAALWTVERSTTAATLRLEPLAPVPRTARREVEAEAGALLAWHEPESDRKHVRWS